MAKIEKSPAEKSHFIYISDLHVDGYVPIYEKSDLQLLIKLASESLSLLEKEEEHELSNE